MDEFDEMFGLPEYDAYDPFEVPVEVEKAAYGIIGESDPWDDFERDYSGILPY